jgi:hypothetical protein
MVIIKRWEEIVTQIKVLFPTMQGREILNVDSKIIDKYESLI